ncbi:MAG: hypothetical protein KJ914_17205 [Gammaproteobacteria bacterium]|nr:hypothetical protein [Gammaproteobacteria bacterium]MBU1725536.1 hypothetical protein [Gammaproteobacteria bacterium]MBU2004856.1 hypothetical protein [Gammaproteobacteria bacterium]
MLGYIDWIIILIALMAAIGALLLLYPQTSNRDVQQMRDIRSQAERDQKRIADVLEITQHGAQDAEALVQQLKTQVAEVSRNYQAAQAKAEQVERMVERVSTAEHEMRDISSQLGDRLQHLQTYWDEQLGDSVESVKRIRGKLREGLEDVDASLIRLHDQEKMAQGFTRKLIEHHQEQVRYQQENSRLSTQVHARLEEMLQESSHMLEQMKRYQHDADAVFRDFSAEMQGLESQANEHFTALFQTSDQARTELSAGLEESRQHLGEMRLREAQSDELSRKMRQQFDMVDHMRVERISQTLDLTDQISTDLHRGVENARKMLSTLSQAVFDVSATLAADSAATQPEAVNADQATEQFATARFEAAQPDMADGSDADKELLDFLAEPETAATADDAGVLDLGDLKPLDEMATADADANAQTSNLVSLRAYR